MANELTGLYQECMNMDLTQILHCIVSAESEEEQEFYTNLYNLILKKRQKELVADGIF